MRALTAVASVAYPILLLALEALGITHGLGNPLALGILLVLPVLIGRLGGWWALPIFAAAVAADVVLYQVLFWTDDPTLTGTDDLPPVVSIVGLFFLLPLVAVGARWRQRKLERAPSPDASHRSAHPTSRG